MRLVALEFLERRQIRIRIAEADHEADHHLVVIHVIEERAAVGVVFERPASRVHHQTGLVLRGIDLPQLLDADAVDLRIGAVTQLESIVQLTAEVAARAFAEQRVLRVQFHAELEVFGRLAVLADAEVAGGHALHRAIVVVQHFGRRKAREDFDAERFGHCPKPARDVREADHVVAVIFEVVRQRPGRHALRAGFRQEQEAVFGHVDRQRRALFLPVRHQFGDRARVHHRARQDMRPDLRALFQYAHAQLDAFFSRQLFQADRRGQASRAAADDHHVVFHRLAGAVLLNETCVCHDVMPFL
ncbi:hypothetical protein LMG27177_07524 [Paraburkholderia fynbosensis]|uniref:Uncharacterized protein n=1 Tax=Paraburkholderia fynbosensis TaxID=1200993 RepID=A0A6J5H8W9_9BURK|nr:hypothetical protein LMG27177_07524 [Paraburkholderia fynbosensis]